MTEYADIVEPVTLKLRVASTKWAPIEFERTGLTIDRARRQGRLDATLAGTIRVEIVGADGALLCSYDRSDNLWRDFCRGQLTVDGLSQSCTCGGKPRVNVHVPHQYLAAMGWRWACERCGADTWKHVDPEPASDPGGWPGVTTGPAAAGPCRT